MKGIANIALVLIVFVISVGQSCVEFNWCNGHGKCSNDGTKCNCDIGWGSSSDISLFKAPDCSARVCPYGDAWADVADSSGAAHAPAECSNAGYTGSACQRAKCPNDCSGHGRCKSMRRMAETDEAQVVGPNVVYGLTLGVYSPPRSPRTANSWDADKIFGCVCDSSWPVGYGSGDQFVLEWFGPDCSLRRCPSGFDRGNAVESNALNCFNVTIPNSGSRTRAGQGALCYIECSRQGLCDYKTGACEYYEGYEPPKQNDTVIIEEDDTTIYLRNLERSLEELRRRSGGS
eukprot:gene38933-47361_t